MIDNSINTLIKNPENITENDLDVLQSEIIKFPYAQSLRAILLYGTHRFNKEKYQEELSVTAAHTTDKKILYRLVNGVSKQETNAITKVSNFNVDEIAEVEIFTPPKPVYVEGQLNRILFEGEENFLNEETTRIDLEQTLESGSLVTEKAPPVFETERNFVDVDNQSTPEVSKPINDVTEIVTEENQIGEKSDLKLEEPIVEKKPKVIGNDDESTSELSFHNTDEFLPSVKIETKTAVETIIPQQNKQSKHEDEMQRLIAEVEAKMKANKKPKTITKDETIDNNDINFAEGYLDVTKPIETKQEPISEPKEELPTTNPAWKPMPVSSNAPDSEKVKKNENNIAEEKVEKSTSPSEERPVMNISFFTEQDDLSKIDSVKPLEKEESNVPVFINTWQKWLKLDRTETTLKSDSENAIATTEEVVERKEKVIEKFIENEPKISRLKEDTSFVVKEKADDISHLMTETLAKLYTEQKLYSKAIKAYETLQKKHPEKASYFNEQIEKIKEMRSNK